MFDVNEIPEQPLVILNCLRAVDSSSCLLGVLSVLMVDQAPSSEGWRMV
jgi:hypothetical protein